ncbi:MAG: 4-(cytidine 5'-diphospho)-2-C-methyl-D-erythritol kinase [Elusimicrobia bacterium]|nr:4-(cytidine 5'-diphospho)-2-C-methyl-D-erythritol kinase [Candidatus Liberimonas magnetica]
MQLLAPAKLNLFLEVINRKKNGYHNIQTIFQTISLYDKITILPRKSTLSLDSNSNAIPKDMNNLVLKAAFALREKLKTGKGAHLYIEKHIPIGAGLGGGSSDAAAVLKGLQILWKKKLPRKALSKIAVKLGADVPFFLSKGSYYASGIGEKLKKITGVKPAWFVVIYPRVQVPTAWAYQNLKFPLTNKQKINRIRQLLASGSSSKAWGHFLFNRLEGPVLKNRPEIADIKKTLNKMGLMNLMSGSGSTVFALVASKKEGGKIRSALKMHPWDIFLAKSVN